MGTNARQRLLFVTYAYPPTSDVGGLRAAKMTKYLARAGWKVTVLTSRFRYRRARDSTTLTNIPSHTRIRRVMNPEPTGYAPSRVRSYIDPLLLSPDYAEMWLPFATRAGRKIIESEETPIVLATGEPWTALLAGASLSRKTGARLVVELRDPWVAGSPIDARGRRKRDSDLEALVMAQASHVIVVSSTMREFILERYPFLEPRLTVVPNAFDEDDFPRRRRIRTSRSPNGPMVVRNFGSIYGPAEMRTVLAATSRLMSSGQVPPDGIRFEVVGGWPQRVLDRLVRNLQPMPLVLAVPRRSHEDSLILMQEADVLLLVRTQEYAYSGKLMEYLASGVPVLVVAPPTSSAAALVKRTGAGMAVPSGDGMAAQVALRRLHASWSNGALSAVSNQDANLGAYTYGSVARPLSQALFNLL